MKNLKLLSSQSFSGNLLKAAKICIDGETSNIYFGSNIPGYIYCLESEINRLTETIVPLGNEISKPDECHIISIDYMFKDGQICLIYSSGDIFLYDPVATKSQFDIVGTFDSTITSAAWSPDQDLLVILTDENKLIMLTNDFNPLHEKDLQPREFGESLPITVGWGSKATQFHGSEGKSAAIKKKTEITSVLPWDDHKPRISWRGDGEYFVTSVIDDSLDCRILRIWNRSGNLQYTSEVHNNLEHVLCWRPSGNYITCTQQHPNKHEVVFFEKNGLPYSSFKLPFAPSTFAVKEVLWNLDSSILVVWGYEINQEEILQKNKFHVLIYTESNHHWYLKQHLDFTSYENLVIRDLIWDTCEPNKLCILCDDGLFLRYVWGWTHHHSPGTELSDDVVMSVIDGANVLVTPLKKLVVPPPMSAYTLEMPLSVNCVAFAPGKIYDHSAYVLSDGRLVICMEGANESQSLKNFKIHFSAAGGNGFTKHITPCCVTGIFRISNDSIKDFITFDDHPLFLHHWTWISSNQLLCTSSYGIHSKTSDDHLTPMATALFSIELPDNYSEDEHILQLNFCGTVNGSIIGMCSNEDGKLTAIQLTSGKIMKYENGVISPWMDRTNKELTLPCLCSQFSLATVDEEVVIFALSERLTLFCNDYTVISKCTSYFVHDEYLVITTSDHHVRCYLKKAVIDSYRTHKNEITSLEVASQPIERGAKIVVAIPLSTSVIFQAPRGNLETIHPRPLVLSVICRLLNQFEFEKAFKMAKRHRINLNILYDHNPKLFLESIETFIEQMTSPENLTLFVTHLQPEDVCQTMYAYYYANKKRIPEVNGEKVDVVCDAIRSALLKQNDNKYNETIIATFVQKSKPEIENALSMIKKLRDSSEKEGNEALKFLLYLKDVSELYKVALGMYDFDIAIMVAEKSNMDPKEYLPFLNNLQELEENYKRYKIDMHLQRYKQALLNISKCVDHFDECLNLIKAQRLYTSALFLFPPSATYFKTIWSEYGNYLMEKMYYNEAGLAYIKAENHNMALRAFQECCEWQSALCIARTLRYPHEMISALCQNMSNKLKENLRFEEAAHLLEFYVNDVEESIVTLIDGQQWDSALNTMTKYNRLDIAETHLKPALKEHDHNLRVFIDLSLKSFVQHFERLKIVRKGKEMTALENDGQPDYPEDDLYSDTSSVVTGASTTSKASSKQLSGSLVTRKSSRNRKKHELKKYRLKEGSPNEDLALMTELSEIITKMDKTKDTFFKFLKTLVQFDFVSEARILQQKMKNICCIIENNIANIWLLEQTTSGLSQGIQFGPSSTANAIAEYMQRQQELIHSFAERSVPQPSWRKNMDIYLHCLDQ